MFGYIYVPRPVANSSKQHRSSMPRGYQECDRCGSLRHVRQVVCNKCGMVVHLPATSSEKMWRISVGVNETKRRHMLAKRIERDNDYEKEGR